MSLFLAVSFDSFLLEFNKIDLQNTFTIESVRALYDLYDNFPNGHSYGTIGQLLKNWKEDSLDAFYHKYPEAAGIAKEQMKKKYHVLYMNDRWILYQYKQAPSPIIYNNTRPKLNKSTIGRSLLGIS